MLDDGQANLVVLVGHEAADLGGEVLILGRPVGIVLEMRSQVVPRLVEHVGLRGVLADLAEDQAPVVIRVIKLEADAPVHAHGLGLHRDVV